MKSGRCPKCGNQVEHDPNDKVAFNAVELKRGRLETVSNPDGSNKAIIATPYFCSNCDYIEFYGVRPNTLE